MTASLDARAATVDHGRGHVRRIMAAGAVDSFGLAFGWTTFNLLAVLRYGLSTTGSLNAAMFCGVALSAPAAGWLTAHLEGRSVLLVTAAAESILRGLTLSLLFWGAPVPVVASCVLVTSVLAWTGYAGMRAEVALASRQAGSMTRYVALALTAEAMGASAAALLPVARTGSGPVIAMVALVYGLSLIPTCLVASSARVRVRPVATERPRRLRRRWPLAAGALLMVLCSGPTLLYVGLTARLYSRTAVATAALAFALGSLTAPSAVRVIARWKTQPTVTWPLWGAGMIVGWTLAPWNLAGLIAAQFLSGVALTSFEGTMDFVLAGDPADGEATRALAQGSAARAVGSAAAVRLVPFASGRQALSGLAGTSAFLALAGGLAVACRPGAGLVGETPAPAQPRTASGRPG